MLSEVVETRAPPPADLGGGSQESEEKCVHETKRLTKRKRAKKNKRARLEARAEVLLLWPPVGDPDDDSGSEDGAAVEKFVDSGVGSHCTEVYCAEDADEDACIEDGIGDWTDNARFRTAAENSRSEEAAHGAEQRARGADKIRAAAHGSRPGDDDEDDDAAADDADNDNGKVAGQKAYLSHPILPPQNPFSPQSKRKPPNPHKETHQTQQTPMPSAAFKANPATTEEGRGEGEREAEGGKRGENRHGNCAA